MNTGVVIVVIVLVLAGAAFGVWAYLRNRTRTLRKRFGPEYGRTVEALGSRTRAENVLEKREKRVDRFKIRPLRVDDQARFAREWCDVQARFVDDPRLSLTEADILVGELMKLRGYPLADFEQRAADISVDHPHVVENYRAGHAIALRHSRGEASTEQMRQAMVHYRTLFEDLLGPREIAATEVRR